MATQRKAFIAGLLYMAIGIVTFGHEAASAQQWVDANCATPEQQLDTADCVPAWGPALVSAILWPLYWSWEAWS